MQDESLRSIGAEIIARVENDEHRARLEGMVIDPSFADPDTEPREYFPRVLPGKRTEVEMYVRALNTGKWPLLMGPAGSGKTTSPIAFASMTGMPIAILKGHNGFDPTTVLSDREQDWETGRWYHRISDFGLVCMYGGIGVADELYRIPAKSSGVLFDIFDDRRRVDIPGVGSVKLADQVLLCGTTNPPSYAGVGDIDLALQDRFSPVMQWDYDPVVEANLVQSKALRDMAADIRKRGELQSPMSTRNLIEFEDLALDLGFDMAVAGLIGRFDEIEEEIVRTVVSNWGPKIRAELGV